MSIEAEVPWSHYNEDRWIDLNANNRNKNNNITKIPAGKKS
jgi:hypothetical protein